MTWTNPLVKAMPAAVERPYVPGDPITPDRYKSLDEQILKLMDRGFKRYEIEKKLKLAKSTLWKRVKGMKK